MNIYIAQNSKKKQKNAAQRDLTAVACSGRYNVIYYCDPDKDYSSWKLNIIVHVTYGESANESGRFEGRYLKWFYFICNCFFLYYKSISYSL